MTGEALRVSKSQYIPPAVFEAIASIHPAIDPETGHFECHYLPIAPGLLEVGGKSVPAVIAGCLAVAVIEGEFEGLKEVGGSIAVSEDHVEAEGARAPKDLLRVYSALLSAEGVKVGLYRVDPDGVLAVVIKTHNPRESVVVVPAPCEEESVEKARGPGIHV
ncbi:MAG: hypothetical protein F7B17_01375 [Desulfurococcales archaeon]|nr:hypothetical protein [Desulfurococcales archaeon]